MKKKAELPQRWPRDVPYIWCRENFRESLSTPTAILLPIFLMGFCSDQSNNVRTKLKFVALPIPEIIGGSPKIWAVPGYAHAPFSPKFFMGFCSDGWTLWTYQPNLQSVALPVPEIVVIAVLGWGCEPQACGRGGRRGVADGTVRKSVGQFL